MWEFEYQKEKDEISSRHTKDVYLYMELDEKQHSKLTSFFLEEKPRDSSHSFHVDISGDIIQQVTKRPGAGTSDKEKNKYTPSPIRFEALSDRVVIETFAGDNPIIPYYEVTHHDTPQDRHNVSRIESFIQSMQDGGSTPGLEPLPTELVSELQSAEWGEEVRHHLHEGDECYRNSLLHPALSSYIHAIEWALISFLKEKEDVDIIQQEKNGDLYYFASGNSILGEVQDTGELSQKSISRIKSLNRAERRWMGHHKSGEATKEELDGMRARLTQILEELFGTDSARK